MLMSPWGGDGLNNDRCGGVDGDKERGRTPLKGQTRMAQKSPMSEARQECNGVESGSGGSLMVGYKMVREGMRCMDVNGYVNG